MPRSILLVFCTLATLLLASAQGATINGSVREVLAGDTFVLRDGKGRLHRVRVLAIAAPTRGQPYHDASRLVLEHLVLHKEVDVDSFSKKGDTEVGKVQLSGDDIAVKLLRRGAVWFDHREAGDQSVADRGIYDDFAQLARRKHRGLWADTHAVAPWLWRAAAKRAAAGIEEK